MATIRSNSDLSGTTVNGILLGPPVIDPITGEFVWDDDRIPEMTIIIQPPGSDDEIIMALLGGAV